jgi:hypothetical protein
MGKDGDVNGHGQHGQRLRQNQRQKFLGGWEVSLNPGPWNIKVSCTFFFLFFFLLFVCEMMVDCGVWTYRNMC